MFLDANALFDIHSVSKWNLQFDLVYLLYNEGNATTSCATDEAIIKAIITDYS